MVTPTIRLGVTGLSRSGKTVFITALVHNLLHGGRLPLFTPYAEGRLARASLQQQPDDTIPRFAYEDHIQAILQEKVWPRSTHRISEMRITLEYESASFLGRALSSGKLHLDIIDYPGEWLLDLPLLAKSYRTWTEETLTRARQSARQKAAADWLAWADATDPLKEASEPDAQAGADAFKTYLAACRADDFALSTLPPGRFLMPGDMEGSPALTFAPLQLPDSKVAPATSLWAMMERRFEAYKSAIVRPFFRDHFARLDRQIVLVDALPALNAGPDALRDLEEALAEILACFRPGTNSWLSRILTRRVEKILFAATKADHLHHESHDRLEALLKRLVQRASERAAFAGSDIEVLAMAAIRATREAEIRQDGEDLPAIIGTPMAGQKTAEETFNGTDEIAFFPGDLPENPDDLFAPATAHHPHPATYAEATANAEQQVDLQFLKYRPPALETDKQGLTLSLPHIRLDRALDFLLGDRLA